MTGNKELKKTGFLRFDSLYDDGGMCTLFMDRSGDYQLPLLIWCNTDGWDHVTASYSDRFLTPEEIELVKRIFFRPGEVRKTEVIRADEKEPRPYAAHIWLQKNRHAPRPIPCDHLPAVLKEEQWKVRINPAFHPAVQLQAAANNMAPEAFLAYLDSRIDSLFSGTGPLPPEDRIVKLCFHKRPSAERFFLQWIRLQEQGVPDMFSSRHVTQGCTDADDSWKERIDPLLHNEVIQQANYNHMPPSKFINTIMEYIEKAYSGDDPEGARIFQTEFREKPDVQTVFLYMVLPKPTISLRKAG